MDGADIAATVTAIGANDVALAVGSDSQPLDVGEVIYYVVVLEPIPSCGDDVADAGEECDGADLAGEECLTIGLGFTGGALACDASCLFDTGACTTTSPGCGNGVAESGEACDGADLGGDDCTTIGMGFTGGGLACAANCSFDVSSCTAPPGCGDGTIDPPEECDGGVLPGATCASVTGLPMGTLTCTGGCVFDTSDCSECGNGVAEGPELCDGADLGLSDCTTEGFDGGVLVCDASCGLVDTSGCYDAPTIPVLRSPMNDAYQGSIFVAGSLQPVFDWDASTGMGGPAIDYEIQYSQDSTFASGVTAATTAITTYTPPSALSVSMTAPVGARYYWRVRACAGTVCSAYATRWVNVGRSDRDFTGDGYADVAVGAPFNDDGGGDAGKVTVYFGGPGGTLNTVVDRTILGGAGDFLGSAVAAGGDVNADGFADLLVAGANAVYLYMGGSGAAFDTISDGTLLGTAGGAAFAGDVNGDGFSDIVAAVVGYDGAAGTNSGAAYVSYGAAGSSFPFGVDLILEGLEAGEDFGSSVSGAGDVNNDGLADVIVGAPGNDDVGSNGGAAYVFLGGVGALDPTADGVLLGAAAGDNFGASAAGAGDVNADSYADVIVGALLNDFGGTSAGRAYVFYGGPGTSFDPTANATLTGTGAGDTFGNSVAGAGDLNGDGADDVLVGAEGYDGATSLQGAAYLFYGTTAGPFNTAADGTLTGANAFDLFGSAVSGAGDVNSDGFDDIIIGAGNSDSVLPNAGAAFVYMGAAGLFNATVDGTLGGSVAGDQFGVAVAAQAHVYPQSAPALLSGRRRRGRCRRRA